MSDTVTKEITQALNERKETVDPTANQDFRPEDLFPARMANEEISAGSSFAEDGQDEIEAFESYEESAGKPAYLDDFEDDSPKSEDDHASQVQGISALVSGLILSGKEFINGYLNNRFRKRLNTEFSDKEKKILEAVIFLDRDQKLSSTNISAMKEWAVLLKAELIEFVGVANRYREIRDALQAKPLEEWQKEGLEKYVQLTVQKYFVGTVDPALMLTLYIALIFGVDVVKIFASRKE